RFDFVERRGPERPVADPTEARVLGRGQDPVHPGPPVHRAWLGEGGAADLLGVQAGRRLLRGVAVLRARPLDRLGGELVAEAAQRAELLVGPLACLLPAARRFSRSCRATASGAGLLGQGVWACPDRTVRRGRP